MPLSVAHQSAPTVNHIHRNQFGPILVPSQDLGPSTKQNALPSLRIRGVVVGGYVEGMGGREGV